MFLEVENEEGDAMGWWMKRSWHEAYDMAEGPLRTLESRELWWKEHCMG